MARIRPFTALRPRLREAEKLLFPDQQDPNSGLRSKLERLNDQGLVNEESQPKLYHEIRQSLADLIEEGKLVIEDTAGIYFYECSSPDFRSKGIWTLTDLEDYRCGVIKEHEQTFAAAERQLMKYRQYAQIEGTPVLLTYNNTEKIRQITEPVLSTQPLTALVHGNETYKLWKIEDEAVLLSLMTEFASIKDVYIADGHHRMKAACNLYVESPNSRHYISTLYIATEDLHFGPYFRAVLPLPTFDPQDLWNALFNIFTVIPSPRNEPVEPNRFHLLGLYINEKWYRLLRRPGSLHLSGENKLDIEVLHELILAQVFGIYNPQADVRLQCIGGETAMKKLQLLLAENPEAVGFTLCPLSVDEIIAAAAGGRVLPPKASWINPKIPFGFLLYHPQINQLFCNENR